jgi:hypothetical protein
MEDGAPRDAQGLRRVIALLSSGCMPQILIRRLDQQVVRRLRAKAARDGISAEEEARRILRRSLVGVFSLICLVAGDPYVLSVVRKGRQLLRLGES